MKSESYIFRQDYAYLLKRIIVLCIAGGAVFLLAIIFFKGGDKDFSKAIEALLILEVVVFPFCFLLGVAHVFTSKVCVDKIGLSTIDPRKFNKKKTLKWSAIHRIEKIKQATQPYVAFSSEDYSEYVLVPLPLKNWTAFCEIVESSLGKEHQVAKELRTTT